MEPLDVHDASRQQLALLADVGAVLETDGFEHWLFGGWAVDFHVGRVTRTHSDIDLAVWDGDASAIQSTLRASGWEHAPAPDEDGGTGYELAGVRLELTYLEAGENGEVFVALRDRNVLWSENPLGDAVLELDGVRARVVPLELLRRGKSTPRDDPEEAEIDRADFTALSRLML
jgi:hypothetical protein